MFFMHSDLGISVNTYYYVMEHFTMNSNFDLLRHFVLPIN